MRKLTYVHSFTCDACDADQELTLTCYGSPEDIENEPTECVCGSVIPDKVIEDGITAAAEDMYDRKVDAAELARDLREGR